MCLYEMPRILQSGVMVVLPQAGVKTGQEGSMDL